MRIHSRFSSCCFCANPIHSRDIFFSSLEVHPWTSKRTHALNFFVVFALPKDAESALKANVVSILSEARPSKFRITRPLPNALQAHLPPIIPKPNESLERTSSISSTTTLVDLDIPPSRPSPQKKPKYHHDPQYMGQADDFSFANQPDSRSPRSFMQPPHTSHSWRNTYPDPGKPFPRDTGTWTSSDNGWSSGAGAWGSDSGRASPEKRSADSWSREPRRDISPIPVVHRPHTPIPSTSLSVSGSAKSWPSPPPPSPRPRTPLQPRYERLQDSSQSQLARITDERDTLLAETDRLKDECAVFRKQLGDEKHAKFRTEKLLSLARAEIRQQTVAVEAERQKYAAAYEGWKEARAELQRQTNLVAEERRRREAAEDAYLDELSRDARGDTRPRKRIIIARPSRSPPSSSQGNLPGPVSDTASTPKGVDSPRLDPSIPQRSTSHLFLPSLNGASSLRGDSPTNGNDNTHDNSQSASTSMTSSDMPASNESTRPISQEDLDLKEKLTAAEARLRAMETEAQNHFLVPALLQAFLSLNSMQRNTPPTTANSLTPESIATREYLLANHSGIFVKK